MKPNDMEQDHMEQTQPEPGHTDLEQNTRVRKAKVAAIILLAVFLLALAVAFYMIKRDMPGKDDQDSYQIGETLEDTSDESATALTDEQMDEEEGQGAEEEQGEEESLQAEEERRKAQEEQEIAQADALFMEMYDGDYEKECAVDGGAILYRMVIRDAAAGSRAYSLLKSTDGGATWEMASSMPFGDRMGMGIDFTFLDENFGFASLAHNGGDEAELYVTEDGGLTYELCTFEEVSIALSGSEAASDDATYNPYDYPEMPYEQNGVLYVLCGQGQDGDYNGGDKVLYTSTDGGHTFSLCREAND